MKLGGERAILAHDPAAGSALGRPQVQDPTGLDAFTAIGLDEHAWRRGRVERPTQFATGIVDLTPGRPARLLDLVQGRSGVRAADLAAHPPRRGEEAHYRGAGPASAGTPPRWATSSRT